MTELRSRRRRPLSVLRELLESEASGGLILMAVAALAIVVANSPLSEAYFGLLHRHVGGLSILDWVNDGLMAIFFLLVGLEIKREMVDGELSNWPRRALPGIAALGGMIVPALIFLLFNREHPEHLRGWAISSATDIAFALGAISLLGDRLPVSLKVFLAALAILDDLGAVIIIAIFYTADLSLPMIGLAGLILLGLAALNRFGVKALWPYLGLGVVLWFVVFQSGLHATLAGVALAMTIPIIPSPARPEDERSPLHRLEHRLAKPVAFLIVPLFGFANAGVSFTGVKLANLIDPLPIGVALGLFLGKQIGVFSFSALTIRLKLAELPAHATWLQFYGVAILCGIGFTMSLFIGLLAFANSALLQDETKIGVLCGSILSGLIGLLWLRIAPGNAGERS